MFCRKYNFSSIITNFTHFGFPWHFSANIRIALQYLQCLTNLPFLFVSIQPTPWMPGTNIIFEIEIFLGVCVPLMLPWQPLWVTYMRSVSLSYWFSFNTATPYAFAIVLLPIPLFFSGLDEPFLFYFKLPFQILFPIFFWLLNPFLLWSQLFLWFV